MINLVAQGGTSLDAMRDQANAIGTAFTDIDAAKVHEAESSLNQVWGVVGGLGNSIAVELSPFITAAAEAFVGWGTDATKSGSFATQAMDWVVSALLFATDGVNVFKTAFHGVNAVISEMVSYFLAGIDKILAGVDWVVEKLTGAKSSFGGTLKEWSEAFEATAVHELDAAEKAWGEWDRTTRRFALW